MHPDLFLDVAKDWADNHPTCEGHFRSSISRAYYAAFHFSRGTVEALELEQPADTGSHKRIILALKRSGDKELSALGRKLEALKVIRESADYDIHYPLPVQNLELSIRKAENIIERCQEQLSSDQQSGS